VLFLYNCFASDNSSIVYKVQHYCIIKITNTKFTNYRLHFVLVFRYFDKVEIMRSHRMCTEIRYFFGGTAQFGRKLDDVTRAQEHDNLLTYIPPESVAPAGCDDDAFATAWWRLVVTCQWRSRAASACAACRRLFSRTWTRTPPADQTDRQTHPHIKTTSTSYAQWDRRLQT